MTARLHLTCDHYRDHYRCPGQWSGSLTKYGGTLPAVLAARADGWTTDGRQHQCPAPGHDEQPA